MDATRLNRFPLRARGAALHYLICLPLLLGLALQLPAAEKSAYRAEIHYFGLFDTKTGSTRGRIDLISRFAGLQRTDRVPAQVGATFGIYYSLATDFAYR